MKTCTTNWKKFQITYSDCGETLVCTFKGYDRDHAEERFYDSFIFEQGDTRGIEVIKIEQL